MSAVSDLSRKSISAVKWSTVCTGTRYVMQLVVQIPLARLLGPENFGLFAMGMLVLTLSSYVSNFGFAWSLVQLPTLAKNDIRFVVTWQVLSGSLAALLLYIFAGAIAIYFHEPRVEEIVQWLSLTCILNAIAAPATSLMTRAMDFRALSIIQLASYTIGYLCVGVPLAFFGAGVWALVAAWLTQSMVSLIFSVLRSRYPLKPLIWYERATKLWNIGFIVYLNNICCGVLGSVDRVFLGRFLNASEVGFYTAGYNLAQTPNGLLTTALEPVFSAVGARLQETPDKLRSACLSVMASVWILVTPMFVLLGIVAPDLVIVLYGPAWEASGEVLRILAFAMPAYVLWSLTGSVFWNTGHANLEWILQIPIIIAAVILLYALADRGIVMVALVVGGLLVGRALITVIAACYLLHIGWRDLIGVLNRGTAMILLAAGSSVLGTDLGHAVGTSHFIFLSGGVLLGCLVLMSIPFVFPLVLNGTVVEAYQRLRHART